MSHLHLVSRVLFFVAFCFYPSLMMADTNVVHLGPLFTNHFDSNLANGVDQGGIPEYAYDENYDTYYGSAYNGSDGAVTHTVIVEATFLFPVDLTQINYRMSAAAGGYSDYINICSYSMGVEYKTNNIWYELPGSSYQGSGGQGDIGYDTGIVSFTIPIANVEGLRSTVTSYAYYTGGGSYYHAHSYVYELQGWGEAPLCFQHGDVNFDGTVSAGDAQTVFFFVLGLVSPTDEEWCAADCNGDYALTAADAQQIFFTVLGLDSCVDSIPG